MQSSKFKAFLELGRVPNLPTCISNATAGFYLAGGNLIETPLLWFSAVLAIVCFYEAGMVLNDLCDYSLDQAQRSSRPLPSGRATPVESVALLIVLLASGLGIVRYFIPQAIPIAWGLLGLVFVYNWTHQWLVTSPILMGACRGSVYLLAASAAGWKINEMNLELWLMAGTLMIYISAISFIARFELENRTDLIQKFSILVAALCLAVPVLNHDQFSFLIACTFSAALAWLTWIAARLLYRRLHPMSAVGKMLAGMSLLDALVLAEVQSTWGVLLAWGCFIGTLNWHRRIQGT
jgi:4-hydroxybenzoate polyprenyltransferase